MSVTPDTARRREPMAAGHKRIKASTFFATLAGCLGSLTRTVAAASLIIAAGISAAQAEILAFGSNNSTVNVSKTVQPVPLRPNGARFIKFRTIKTNTPVAVTYNAVCRAVGPGLIGFVAVSITVDGVEIGPGGNDFPMCSPPKDGLTIMYAANSRQIAVRVPNPGEHTVQVLTVLGSTATAGDLFGHSIIIQD